MALIVFAVLALLFLFVCYMAFQTWRAWHVAILFGVFLFTMVFCFLAASALKTHQVWKKKEQELSSRLETQQKRLAELVHGDLLTADEEDENLLALNSQYAQLVVDRGRVWRNVFPVAGADGITLNMSQWGEDACFGVSEEEEDEFDDLEPVPEGDQPAAAAPTPTHGLTQGMLVFAFLEGGVAQLGEARTALFGESELPAADTKGVCRVPVSYLGSYRITAVTGNSISIEPVLPLDPQQLQDVQAQATWVLYEMMPTDSHSALAGLTEEQLRTLVSDAVVAEYARDLKSALPSDEESRTLRKIKFLRDFEVEVDVDGDEPGIDRDFDPSGRAILANLRQGEATKFQAGDTPNVYFPAAIARQWQRDGICEFVDEEPLFVRPLRDYAYYFYQKDLQIGELNQVMEILKKENESIAAAEAKAREQQEYREEELSQLGQDRAKIDQEIAILTRYRDELAERQKVQRSELGSLYEWINQVADELRGRVYYGAQSGR